MLASVAIVVDIVQDDGVRTDIIVVDIVVVAVEGADAVVNARFTAHECRLIFALDAVKPFIREFR